MDADLHAVIAISRLDGSMRTRTMIENVLTRSFVDKHPTLVRMLEYPHLDAGIVQSLVDRLAAVREGRQDLEEASVQVGETLLRAYGGSLPSRQSSQ